MMLYDISILEPQGVSSVMLEGEILAREAVKLGKKRVLDIGTGTGYIAIYLTMKGYKCDGTDISKKAIKTAKLNSRRNNLQINFFESDLFNNVRKKYDLIVFNPPLGGSGGNITIDTVKSLVRRTPFLYRPIKKLIFKLFINQRIELNRRFIRESKQHLNKDGNILFLIYPEELNNLRSFAKDLGFEITNLPIKELMQKRHLLLILLKIVT